MFPYLPVLNGIGYHDIFNGDKFLSNFLLTEICIGWKAVGEGNKKVYEMQIYPLNKRLLSFIMVRGMATIENIDLNNGSFELHLATSKFDTYCHTSSPDFDLKIKVIFVKNTTVKKIITKEEELAYKDYAEKITQFCCDNTVNYPNLTMEDLQKEAIKKLGPLNLTNQSKPKFLRQKLKDFQQAIYLLCNPENGSFANIPVNEYDPETKKSKVCRFYQQVECLLFLRQSTWYTNRSRALHHQIDKFYECENLDWANTTLRNMDFAFQNLRDIDFDNVDLGESLKYWHTFASNINFKRIYSISMRNCGIKKLDDEFFKFIPGDALRYLNFIDNDIQYISRAISKLFGLVVLNLNGNKNLSESSITWSMMPPCLKALKLEGTNINNVPKEIGWLRNLSVFKVNSPRLENINWRDFHKNIEKISITGKGNEVNDVELSHLDDVVQLTISNLKFKKIYLPKSLRSLHLINTHLGAFNTYDIRCHIKRSFEELTLSGNELKEFLWEGCRKEIKRLVLSNNLLKDISIKDNTLTFRDFAELTEISFENNKINFLPEGFENLEQLSSLNLSNNFFNYDESDLIKVLWHRLPKTLLNLVLSNNNIIIIPCLLKSFNIRNLRVIGCNLHYCCPYLHANIQNSENYMVIDAANNPKFNLSFIPSKIFQLPKKTEIKQVRGKALYHPNLIPNYANFPTTTLKGNFCDSSKTLYSKAAYTFSSEGIKQNDEYACKCCGMCGNSTDEPLFQQQMAPDSILLIQEEEGKEDTKTTTYHCPFKPPIYYKPGQWRTQIKSRLCCSCKKVLLEKIDKAFDPKMKKKKCNSEISNEEISQEGPRIRKICSKLQNSKNANDDVMEIEQEITPMLPPVETFYSSSETFDIDFCTLACDLPLLHTFENNILMDHDGKEYGSWKQSITMYSSDDSHAQEYLPIKDNLTTLTIENSNPILPLSSSDNTFSWRKL